MITYNDFKLLKNSLENHFIELSDFLEIPMNIKLIDDTKPYYSLLMEKVITDDIVEEKYNQFILSNLNKIKNRISNEFNLKYKYSICYDNTSNNSLLKISIECFLYYNQKIVLSGDDVKRILISHILNRTKNY